MSGDVHRRHPATLVLAAALACALVWLGFGPRVAEAAPPAGHAYAGIVVVQPAGAHVAQRVAARMAHVRAAVVAASQRHPIGADLLRTVAVALLVLFGVRAWRHAAPRHPVARMHGVRGPPSSRIGSGAFTGRA